THLAGEGHAEDGRHPRADRLASCPRMGTDSRRDHHRGPAPDRHLHERIPDPHLDLRARAGACRGAGVRPPDRAGRTSVSPEWPRFRRSPRQQCACSRLVCAAVHASRAGPGRGHFSAAAAGVVVPACRGAARMSEATQVPLRLRDLISAGRQVEHHAPWPRAVVDRDGWRQATGLLSSGQCVLLGLWGEREQVHMALDDSGLLGVLSLVCDDKRFPSVGQSHPPAIRLERAIRDLWGFEPEGLADTRPWLDHGRWPSRDGAPEAQGAPRAYDFLPAEGESLHQIPVGPVHAGIIEPGHFRFTANGEAVVRLEARLGYAHKGIERLMEGTSLERAATLAGRVSGDSTVAYALAFARAVEAALGIEVPRRALWLRALMAETERLANHFGDIGPVCNDAALSLMHAHCGMLRERVLRAADLAFGHRLMRDLIVPGGVASDLGQDGMAAIRDLIGEARRRFPQLVELFDNTASLQDRTVATGILKPALARQYAAGGFVGRASGRVFDARRMPGYPPYDELSFETPVFVEGDVN